MRNGKGGFGDVLASNNLRADNGLETEPGKIFNFLTGCDLAKSREHDSQ